MVFGLTRMELQAPKRGRMRVTKDQPAAATLPVSFYHARRCEACSLASGCTKQEATGPKRSAVYVLTDAPRDADDASKLLRATLPNAKACRFHTTIRTMPPKGRRPHLSEIECCRGWITDDIEKSKPRAIIAVGEHAVAWCIGVSRMDQWRGRRIPVQFGDHRCWVYPVASPQDALGKEMVGRDGGSWRRTPKEAATFKLDIERAVREAGYEEPDIESMPYELPVDLDTLYDGVEVATPKLGFKWVLQTLKEAAEYKRVALDIEASCLRPYAPNATLLSIALATSDWTRAFPISHPEAWWTPRECMQLVDAVGNFCRSRAHKVVHNLPFDLEWLVDWLSTGIVKGRLWKTWECTQTQAYCLDERRHGQSLDDLCFERMGFRLKEQSNLDVKTLATAPIGSVLKYNALDAKYTLMLDTLQLHELFKDGLMGYYQDQVRRAPAITLTQKKGLPVDVKRAKALITEYSDKLSEVKAAVEACDEVAAYKAKYHTPFILCGTGSDKCLKQAFGDRAELFPKDGEGEEKFTTAASAFTLLDSELATNILTHREYTKILERVVPIVPGGEHYYPDGRLHCTFNSTFTATGRLSANNPNVQNFPVRTHKEVRTTIVPPPNHRLVSVDYKQVEVSILAAMSKDRNLTRAMEERKDIHMKYAEMLSKLVPALLDDVYKGDMKKVRGAVKSWITFPFFYGAFPGTAARHILKAVGAFSSKLEKKLHARVHAAAETISEEFWNEYCGVKAWQNRMLKHYEKHGWVACMNGRRRHGPMTMNELINIPIQGSASDVCVDAMVRLSKRSLKEDRPSLQPALNIHDDLTFFVPEATLQDDVADIVEMMLTPSYDWVTVPIGIEVSAGPNWGEKTVIGNFYSDELEGAK